jgi:hypothetical protein
MKAMFEHCVRVYAKMNSEAIEIGEQGELVWEGHTTALFRELELSSPYYTSVMKMLKGMGCVVQIRRGGGNSVSRWQLNYEPDEAAFNVVDSRLVVRQGSLAAAQQQIRDLTKRVTELEAAVAVLSDRVYPTPRPTPREAVRT